MAPGELKWQRFSDGFVIYIPLGAGQVKSPANSILGLLMATGMHCLIGLAAKSPLRVGIDVAWAVELEPNEIYGAAIAYAHHLESKVAQWPRVVVGEGLTDYLQHYVDSASADLSGQARRLVASTCLRFLAQDSDGVKILDYLGPSYQRAAGNAIQQDVLEKANVFIREQLSYWESCEDQEMSRRYREVANYFRSRELRSTVQRA